MTAHVHAELMAEYAEDAMETDKPFLRWEFSDKEENIWYACTTHPKWDVHIDYRKKSKFILINGIEVPEPVKSPKMNTMYVMPDLRKSDLYTFITLTEDCEDYFTQFLHRGLIHSSVDNAIIHAKALLSFTAKKDISTDT